MFFTFNIQKTIQASAVLLQVESNRMSRLRLLKLLYIADREMLRERARPITGDRAVAMDHGPVLTKTYNLIKGEKVETALMAKWDQYICRQGAHDVALISEPGVNDLSEREITKLRDVAARFRGWDEWKISEHTHSFSEWKKNKPPKGSRNRISDDDVFAAAGLSEIQKELSSNLRAEAAASRMFDAD